ncbi:MAG: hypothetical protein Q9168_006856 [Polycauliona sp. 1 TL-2023]
MSLGKSTRVLEALNVLCKASEELLRPHKTELKAAVQKLQSLIEDHSTRNPGRVPLDTNDSSAFSFNGEDPSAPSPDQRTPPQPSPVAPSLIEDFVAGLDKDLERIEKLLSQVSHKAVTCEPTWMNDDPRVVDLQIAGGRQSSPTTKLRRGLSQRSLASEFDDWEKNTYGTSKVKERASNPLVEPSRKLGHIAEFLDNNKDRFHNIPAARAGIEHGIKLLISETLLVGVGFSAILVFQYSRFRKIKFEELDGLKDAIKDSDRIKKLAEQKADWFDHCQRDYNGKWL